jgi:dipeptidyl aminopeptidase/acylaminoacyl peptidase
MPQGGPVARDSWSYDRFVQVLVSRGYAVFQPNFRGSEGSGRSFAEAGFGQWGRRMQDDVTDGVRHLVASGVAAENRICIVGISYGGYAALAGATLTPDLYRCAVSIAGRSDLLERFDELRSSAGARSAVYAAVAQQMGDPDVNRDALIAASPRRHVAEITAPVLLIHGELDDIVPALQSRRMGEALQRAGKTVRSFEIPGVYHPYDGWTTADVQRMFEETERFLAEHMGP